MDPPYEVIVLGPTTSNAECLRGLLQLVLQNTAKQIDCALEIVCEAYGHSKEEICAVVRDHPKMKSVLEESLLPPLPLVQKNESSASASCKAEAEEPKAEATMKGGKKVVIRKKKVPVPPSAETKQ